MAAVTVCLPSMPSLARDGGGDGASRVATRYRPHSDGAREHDLWQKTLRQRRGMGRADEHGDIPGGEYPCTATLTMLGRWRDWPAATSDPHEAIVGKLHLVRTRCELHLAPSAETGALAREAPWEVATQEQKQAEWQRYWAFVWCMRCLESDEGDQEDENHRACSKIKDVILLATNQ